MTLGQPMPPDDWPTIESVAKEMSPVQCAKLLATLSSRSLEAKNPDFDRQLKDIPRYQMFLYCVHAVARTA